MKRILLADDDKNFGLVLKNELEFEGFCVDIATDGVDALLKSLDGPSYDVFLFDIVMPKLDGINAVRIIKKLFPHGIAINLSGSLGPNDETASHMAGALYCFKKPIEVSNLIVCIKNILKEIDKK